MGSGFLFDQLAPLYDNNSQHDAIAEALLREVTGPVGTVLDVATGTGAAAFAALRLLDPAEVTGVDLSAGMIARAREKDLDERVTWLVAPAVPVPVESEVDLVICASSLHFLGMAAVCDWLRVLRPGGQVAFTLPDAGTFRPSADFAEHVAADLPIPSTVDEAAAVAEGFESVTARRWSAPGEREVFLVHGRKPVS